MGKKQRRYRPSQGNGGADYEDSSAALTAAVFGARQRVSRGGAEYSVRTVSASQANKLYRCPGCPNDIARGQAHVVVWREDHLFGSEAGISERRHWHQHCWRIG